MALRAIFALTLASVVASDGGAAGKPKLWKHSGRTAHDPWRKFCGKTWCYDLLEVDADAPEEQIKKNYRKLAREWHPDKNPEKGAREKFQKIAKAYEVLSTDGERAKYDRMMSHPDEYNTAYGVYWYKVQAPPSNVVLVVLLLLGVLSAAHFAVLTQRKTEYNSKLIKLVQSNAGPAQGGTLEIAELFRDAKERFHEASSTKKPVKDKELKESEEFKAMVVGMLSEYNLLLLEPTAYDTVGFKCLYLPATVPKFVLYHVDWFVRHTVQGQPYSEEEKVVLLKSAVEDFDTLNEKQQAELLEKECWKEDALAASRAAKKRI